MLRQRGRFSFIGTEVKERREEGYQTVMVKGSRGSGSTIATYLHSLYKINDDEYDSRRPSGTLLELPSLGVMIGEVSS